ncbi:MAG: T9SS type A sorting domain-containing protein, partial [Flavobacteriaceae bacterium]|nr:T9SS type A sorting domain-containing protein [Flavobacteriaceae bacterium]
ETATGVLIVNSPEVTVTQIDVIDIQGRLVSTQKYDNSNQYIVDLSFLETAMYFVKLYTSDGILTKRIIKK